MYHLFISATSLLTMLALMVACFLMLGLHPRRLPFSGVFLFLVMCVMTIMARYVRIQWPQSDWTAAGNIVWVGLLASAINLNIGIWRSSAEDRIHDRRRFFELDDDGSWNFYDAYDSGDNPDGLVGWKFRSDSPHANFFESLFGLFDGVLDDHDDKSDLSQSVPPASGASRNSRVAQSKLCPDDSACIVLEGRSPQRKNPAT